MLDFGPKLQIIAFMMDCNHKTVKKGYKNTGRPTKINNKKIKNDKRKQKLKKWKNTKNEREKLKKNKN